MGKYVIEDKENFQFKVNREAFTSKEILEKERDAIFSKCWIYIGHESELENKGDFHRRKVAGRELDYLLAAKMMKLEHSTIAVLTVEH